MKEQMSKKRPRVLIEDWLPVAPIGAECQRERGASSALPPLYFLHVWWARRPLIASRAAILASVLPTYSDKWPKDLKSKFPTEKDYHGWFLRFIGIFGDPVAGRKLINLAREKGIKISNPYGYNRAFTNNPEENDLEVMKHLLQITWKNERPLFLDPMAGGGSIPFEALRYGFNTFTNEINPVASVILEATLKYPIKFGNELVPIIKHYGEEISKRARKQLSEFFPAQENEQVLCYIWARTVVCPSSGKPVPLSPNWWLQKGSKPAAVKLLIEPQWEMCRFEVLQGKKAAKFNPDEGTISRGTAISPWTGDTIDGEYIKTGSSYEFVG